MKANEYQKLALRTANLDESKKEIITNAIFGLCGESGEIADYFKKYYFQGHEFDTDVVVNELGDVCWYVALLAKALGVDLETVLNENVNKLKRRYPDGFDKEKSINRLN